MIRKGLHFANAPSEAVAAFGFTACDRWACRPIGRCTRWPWAEVQP
jgi:hypothetical protein